MGRLPTERLPERNVLRSAQGERHPPCKGRTGENRANEGSIRQELCKTP